MDEDNNNSAAGAASTSEENTADNQNQNASDNQNTQDIDFGKERERIQQQQGSRYTPREKAIHSAKSIAAELQKHGVDPSEVFGTGKSGKETEGEDSSGTGKPLSSEDIERIVDERVAKERAALREPILDSKIQPIVRSKDEHEVVKHWSNVVAAHVDDLDQAVQIGWVIANLPRLKDTFAEIMRGKNTPPAGNGEGAGSGQRKGQGKAEPTGKEAEFAKSRGLVWSEKDGRFVSPSRLKHEKDQPKR